MATTASIQIISTLILSSHRTIRGHMNWATYVIK
jgi:predicted P-loop ATPase/GTPase